MIFSERLIFLRNMRNLTQKDVYSSIGMSAIGYQRYEYGEREPAFKNLIALADYFNVSIDYLAGRTDNPEVNDKTQETKKELKPEADINKLLDEKYGKEVSSAFYRFLKLDDFDKGKIAERIKIFLESDKYLKNQK